MSFFISAVNRLSDAYDNSSTTSRSSRSYNEKESKEFLEIKERVTQNGFALYYASLELKNDFEIVKAAVTQNGLYQMKKLKIQFEI